MPFRASSCGKIVWQTSAERIQQQSSGRGTGTSTSISTAMNHHHHHRRCRRRRPPPPPPPPTTTTTTTATATATATATTTTTTSNPPAPARMMTMRTWTGSQQLSQPCEQPPSSRVACVIDTATEGTTTAPSFTSAGMLRSSAYIALVLEAAKAEGLDR